MMFHDLRLSYPILLIPILATLLAFLFLVSREGMLLWTPIRQEEVVETVVEPGKGFSQIVAALEVQSKLPKRTFVNLYARGSGLDRKLKEGRYALGPSWSPAQILEQLSIGANSPLKVTVPPGQTLLQTAVKLAEAGWIAEATAFIMNATGENALRLVGRRTLEGLMAPETYFFDKTSEPEQVLRTMTAQWAERAMLLAGTSELSARLKNGLTLYDTVILASLVEKEAASTIEMATVASVFHNRLRKRWPMGSAATLRYALHDWERGENELPVNLKSPFNTNRKPGLPPHPICIPSEDALTAAIHPADTPYFFFVADGDGGTVFNITHEDHIRAAQSYRKKALLREP